MLVSETDVILNFIAQLGAAKAHEGVKIVAAAATIHQPAQCYTGLRTVSAGYRIAGVRTRAFAMALEAVGTAYGQRQEKVDRGSNRLETGTSGQCEAPLGYRKKTACCFHN